MAQAKPTKPTQPSSLSDQEQKPVESPKSVELNLLVPAAAIQDLWESEDPNAKAQEHFLNYIQVESKRRDEDLQKWDDCERRFEPNELKWIANFTVDNLVFCKDKL